MKSEHEKTLESAREGGLRVEITWRPGLEDYTGYGARTEGRKARYWIGRSCGTTPVLIGLHRRDSRGGGAICIDSIESVRILDKGNA